MGRGEDGGEVAESGRNSAVAGDGVVDRDRTRIVAGAILQVGHAEPREDAVAVGRLGHGREGADRRAVVALADLLGRRHEFLRPLQAVRFGVALIEDVAAGAHDDGDGEGGDVLAVSLPQGEEIVLP